MPKLDGVNGKPPTRPANPLERDTSPASPPNPGPSRLQLIGEHFDGFKRVGNGYMALCPVHSDTRPSLSINEAPDGPILLYCHAGCPTKDIMTVTGLSFNNLRPDGPVPRLIAATYDYVDENGTLLYQVVRYRPKDFRHRVPNGKGGWTWCTKGVRRVLYRLPDLQASKPEDTIFIPEGEKDADILAKLGLTATTNAGGAKSPWTESYTESLHGRHVVLLPDNDPTGWDRVKDVARELHGKAASVKILELPGLPEKGDVTDWLEANGFTAELVKKNPPRLVGLRCKLQQQLRALVEQTEPWPSGGSVDVLSVAPVSKGQNGEALQVLTTGQQVTQPSESQGTEGHRVQHSTLATDWQVAPFPVEVFPKRLQPFPRSVAKAIPCPTDFVGVMMLPVLGTCIGRKRQIEVKASWSEFPQIWSCIVAQSGERKTAAFKVVTEPLRKRQRWLKQRYLKEMRAFKDLPPDERNEEDRPRLKQVLTTDTTIEALKIVLEGNPDGIIYPADEVSGWTRSMCQYKAGQGDDRQRWLSIWSGAQVVCNRVGRPEPIILDDPFVAVTGGIQPDCLGDIIDDGRQDGGAARLLLSYPDPLPNADWTEDTFQGVAEYEKVCGKLWNLPSLDTPQTIGRKAKELWIEWVNDHRRQKPPFHLRPVWSKAEGYSLRLALILFLLRKVCNETTADEVDEPSISGAIKLIDYFKCHARRVYACTADLGDNTRIGRALRWVKRRLVRGDTITARLAQMYRICNDADEAKKLFEDLEELGHGTVTEEAKGSVVFHLRGHPAPAPKQEAIHADMEATRAELAGGRRKG
jgi:hypothetical protein